MNSKNENNKQQQKPNNNKKYTKRPYHENIHSTLSWDFNIFLYLLPERLVTDHIAISMKELSGWGAIIQDGRHSRIGLTVMI